MSYSITGNSGHIAYGIKRFVVDTEAEIDNLPIYITSGSVAFVIETSKTFMLNNAKEWKEVEVGGGGGGSGAGNIYDGGNIDTDVIDIILDGNV